MAASLKINVSSGPVNLFLTLSPTLLERCLDKSVLLPFIKAYNKKQHAEESLETIASVEVSGGQSNGRIDRATASSAAISSLSLLGTSTSVVVRVAFVSESFTAGTASTMCMDTTQLLALRLSSKGRSTAWCFSDSIEPPARPKTSSRRDRDETRAEFESAAVSDFAAEGGHCGGAPAVAEAWRVVFIRRRLASIVRGARSALQGKRHDEADADVAGDEARSLSRKKDAPDPADSASVRRFVKAQAAQASMAKRRLGHSQRQRTLIAPAAHPLPGGLRVWEAPAQGSAPAFQHPMRQGSAQPHCPLRRCVVEGLCTTHECSHAIGMAVLGIDGAVDYESPEYNGEATLVCSPLDAIPPFLGPGGRGLISVLLWRVLSAVRTHFEEERPLYLSGALLTRLQPPPTTQRGLSAASVGDRYKYDVAHVDRANVASYDYSAVLYLNGKGDEAGGGFRGGDFCFVDEGGDEVVEPRPGRCVLFPSGFEQLHRVCRVDGGNRFALAVWFTLDEKSSDGPVEPAPYQIVHPVPPPTKEELDADATNIDELRSQVERKMASDDTVQRLYGVET